MLTVVQALKFSGVEDGNRQGAKPLADLPDTVRHALIGQLRNGDHTAFDTVYCAFYPRLLAIATGYVRSMAIAEEIAQDTLMMVWERRTQWKDNDSLVIYLYATTRNRSLKHLRHEGIIGRVEAAAIAEENNLGSGTTPESADTTTERADLHATLTRALNRLPEMQRTAFTLRWIHQLSYDEVAETMGVSLVSARKHVARARATLMEIAQRFA